MLIGSRLSAESRSLRFHRTLGTTMNHGVDLLPNGLELAPVWRRAAAALINVLAVIAGVVAAGVAVFGGVKLGLTRRLAPALRPLSRRWSAWAEGLDHTQGPAPVSAQTRLLISVPSVALDLDARNRRWVGARVMRIRRVDVRTGGPITLRAALIEHVVSSGYTAATSRILSAIMKRSTSRIEEIQPALRELQRVHAGNPEAINEATIALYREHNVHPFASCLWTMLSGLFVRAIPVILSPLRQSIPERAARIVTVLDEPRAGLAPRG